MKDKRSLRDLGLIAALLAVALVIFLAASARGSGTAVEVRLNGELYATLPLSSDEVLDIDGLCVLEISDGEASISSAVCKNQICRKHRPISRAGEVIVCLPNGVTVKIIGDGGVDFVI